MEDLIQLLFVAAFILFGVLGGRKKKPAPQGRPRPRPGPGQRPQARTRPAPQTPRNAQEAVLRELEALLGGRQPEPAGMPAPDRVPDPVEARSLESLEVEETDAWDAGLERASEVRDTARWTEGRDRRAASLETLEGAGTASHAAFHRRYDLSAPATVTARAGPAFPLDDVRRAVIWSEILGPPVSLR